MIIACGMRLAQASYYPREWVGVFGRDGSGGGSAVQERFGLGGFEISGSAAAPGRGGSLIRHAQSHVPLSQLASQYPEARTQHNGNGKAARKKQREQAHRFDIAGV